MNNKNLESVFLKVLRERKKDSTKAQQVLTYIDVACGLYGMDKGTLAKEVLGTTTQSLRNYERYEAGKREANCHKLDDAKAQSFIDRLGVYGNENYLKGE